MGHDPTPEQLAAHVGLPVQRVLELSQVGLDPVSLDSPIGEDDASFGDFIEDSDAIEPLSAISGPMLHQHLDALLRTLPLREQRILHLRFGMTDGQPRTLEEVGREFGVTRERIRQIETRRSRSYGRRAEACNYGSFLD